MRHKKRNSKASLEYHYGVSVYAIVERDGKILLTQDHYRPGWKLPGGGVEDGELLVDALVREVNEEVGLKILPYRLLLMSNWIKKETGEVRLRVYFVAEAGSGAPRPQDGEVEAVKWVTREQLEELRAQDFLLPQHYFIAIQTYLKDEGAIIELEKTRRGSRYDITVCGAKPSVSSK